jgi:hypothetical protein
LRLPPAVVAAAAALAAPAGAEAHIRSGIVATDYRASVRVVPSVPGSGVAARVYAGDRALSLVVARGHVVSVLRSPGAPALRIDARSASRTEVWHDVRLRDMPPRVEHRRWTVPLIIDGTPARLSGEIHRVRAPRFWPWLAVGLVFLVPVAVLRGGSRRRLRVAGFLFAGCTAIATLATAVGFAASRSASTGHILEGLDETALVAAGVVLLMRGTRERQAMAGVGLGFLALIVGTLKLAVFTHGVVLSALGATAARACVVVALWSGVAAIVSGGWLAARPIDPSRSLRFDVRVIDRS